MNGGNGSVCLSQVRGREGLSVVTRRRQFGARGDFGGSVDSVVLVVGWGVKGLVEVEGESTSSGTVAMRV